MTAHAISPLYLAGIAVNYFRVVYVFRLTHIKPIWYICVMAGMGSTVINIRNAPENLVRRAKAKAAMEGKTLKDFVLEAIEKALGVAK